MVLIIIGGVLTLVALVIFFYGVFSDVTDSVGAIIMSVILIIYSTIILIIGIDDYTSPHHGLDPKMSDYPSEACMDTIYRHHEGEVYVSYELRWKDDKVWEED